jgi:predicted nuclease with TOPRIM domain
LFKTISPVFQQLVTTVRSHVSILELTAVADAHVKSIAEDHTLWSEFVQDAFRVIQRHSDALLADNIEVRSESTHIASLKAKLEETTRRLEAVEDQNAKLREEVEESRGVIDDLEKQNAELRLAISTLEKMLGSAQENECS